MRRLGVSASWTLAGLFAFAVAGVAHAEPTRKVHVETDPVGATVYIGDTDSGPKCEKTPCDIDAPIGEPTIIIRLENYEPLVENMKVPKRGGGLIRRSFKLRSAVGTIVVPAPKGAVVSIDGDDKGKIGSSPLTASVSAESHFVNVKLGDKTYFDDAVDVAVGDEVEIGPARDGWNANGVSTGGDGGGVGDGGGGAGGGGDSGGGGGGDSGGGDTAITASVPAAARESYLNVSAVTDIGFRRFSYDRAQPGGNLKPESEDGQVIAGPAVEFFPLRALHVAPKSGLSLFGRAELGVHGQALDKNSKLMGTVTTFWASYEVSLRYRRNINAGFGFEVGGGFVRDQMQFNATDGNDIALVPDAIYDSVRLGGKLIYVSGRLDAYFAAETRIVVSPGGALATRFDANSAKATGVRGGLGASYAITRRIFARGELALMHYSWTFTSDNSMEKADGATDSVGLISLQVGYRF